MITSIIHERENLSQEAISEVSSKWANAQLIKGPVLSIPLIYELEKKDGMVELTRYLHVLPEELNINGKIDPEQLKRGIYEVVVYKSNLSVNGSFSPETLIDRNNLREVKWDQAFITIGISDLRGIKEDIILDWNKEHIKAEPGSKIADLISSGVTIDLPKGFDPTKKSIDFQFNLQLQGSENMSFVPLGGTTNYPTGI
ncbi:inner membrane CreD family protein [Marinoscillum sp.]|uniref:inner membrane CreD family protein n=1 Tax=Marinoscillum sp. TaxID=2024838 RepID=UPI003BAA9634